MDTKVKRIVKIQILLILVILISVISINNAFADRNCKTDYVCVLPGDFLKYASHPTVGYSFEDGSGCCIGNLTYAFEDFIDINHIKVNLKFDSEDGSHHYSQKRVMDISTGLLGSPEKITEPIFEHMLFGNEIPHILYSISPTLLTYDKTLARNEGVVDITIEEGNWGADRKTIFLKSPGQTNTNGFDEPALFSGYEINVFFDKETHVIVYSAKIDHQTSATYYDSHYALVETNVFGSNNNSGESSKTAVPQLSTNKITIPSSGKSEEIILYGNVANHKRGTPLAITLINPDDTVQTFAAVLTDNGDYRTAFSINADSPSGVYKIQLFHNGANVGTVSFIASKNIPDWIKNNAKWWSGGQIKDSEFLKGIEYLVQKNIIHINKNTQESDNQSKNIPDWIKNNAKWWSEGLITEDDFLKGIEFLVHQGIIIVN